MKTLPLRRAAAIGFAVALATITLSACGGSPTSTPRAAPPPTFAGISELAPDKSVAVRDLYVPNPGAAGYPAGATVPVMLQVWNNTNATVSLTGATFGDGIALALVGGDAQSGTTFDVAIPAGGSVSLSQQSGKFLQIRCTPRPLALGSAAKMAFTFSNGAKIEASVPVGQWGPGGTPVPDAAAPAEPACT